ncbi:MAG: hypothetical protein Q3980_01825 [Turicibacter sp.]|nr:hypothetical protein [Turicibacter sp.]
MKRALICFMLGFSVIGFLCIGGLRPKVQLTDQAQQNISLLATAAMRLTDHVKLWLSDYVEETEPVISTVDSLPQKEALIDYDAALKIVCEIIDDIEELLTPDQKKAIEREVNELYKQSILKEYKNQIGPQYYE